MHECDLVRYCAECGGVLHRIPQPVRVNWNGLPPHKAAGRSPELQTFIDTADERRAKYLDTERKK